MTSVPGSFWEWMATLNSGELTGLMFLSVVAIVFIVTVVFCTIYLMHKNRLEDSLKRELLDRGMSAEEIVAVVRARPTKKAAACLPHSPSSRSHIA
jgi:hypothetical protein